MLRAAESDSGWSFFQDELKKKLLAEAVIKTTDKGSTALPFHLAGNQGAVAVEIYL